jgi:WD40 repeat protein
LLATLKFSPEFSSKIVTRLSDSGDISQKIGLGRLGQEYVLSATNMAIEKLKSEILEGQEYETFALSGDGNLLATGETNGTIKIWDLRNKTLLHVITAHRSVREFYSTLGINQLQFSPDNLALVSVGYDQLLRAWNVQTGERIAQANISQPGTTTPIVFLEDGSHFFLISERVEIKMFSAETYQIVATLRGADQLTPRGAYNIISSMKMSPDGNYFIYSDRNGNLIFWDPYERKPVKSLRFPVGISDLSFSDGGDLMFVTLFGGIVSVWGAPTPQP